MDMFIKVDNVLINHDFNNGIEVEVKGPDPFYLVELREFVGSEDMSIVLESYYIGGSKERFRKKFRLPIKFHFDFEIVVYRYNFEYGLERIYNHRFNLRDKLVKFELKTSDENECRLWVESVKRFSKKYGCIPWVVSEFEHINQKFLSHFNIPTSQIYKTYEIGKFPKSSNDFRTLDRRHENQLWFGWYKLFWSYEHPRDYTKLNPQELVDDILGFS